MANKLKTFKVKCETCNKPFYVSFAISQPDIKGYGLVIMKCLYCKNITSVKIPRKYINEKKFKTNIHEVRKKFDLI